MTKTRKQVSRKVAVATQLRRAGQMTEKRLSHFKRRTQLRAKAKKEDWI